MRVICRRCGNPSLPCECSEADEWPAAEHAIYQPPYTEYGVMYGPRTEGAANRERRIYECERYGAIDSAALYDHSQEHSPSRIAREVQRYDAELFEARIPSMAASMAKRERECAMLFWRSRASVGTIARVMGVSPHTVRQWIHDTRKRLTRSA